MAKDTCLALKHPGLANEWHPTKNGNLTPHDVTPGSGKKFWWKCDKGEDHEWPATINNRTSRRSGCPVCAGKRPSKDHNLAIKLPDVAKEWHPTENGDLTPFDVTPGMNKRVWWKGNCGHEWTAKINDRTSRHSRCPFCFGTGRSKSLGKDNNLAALFPQLAEQWHPTKNGKLSPLNVSPRNPRKVWWKCREGEDHVWLATVSGRTSTNSGTACPFCLGRRSSKHHNLAISFPELAAEWHPTKNGLLTPYGVTPGSNRKIWWKCKRGHEWPAAPLSRTSKSSGCPHCKPQTSRPELRVFCELKTIFDGVKWYQKLGGIWCDVYLSKHGIGIEYDGHYWHRGREESDEQKESGLAEIGVTLFRIREHGLKTLSETDIVLDPKEADFSVMRKLLNNLLRHHEFSPEDRRSITNYLASNRLMNDKEFKDRVALLPGPPLDQSLASLNPEISDEWNFDRNLPLEPTMFFPGSNEKVWWQCEWGHEWPAKIDNRTRGTGCPYCEGHKAAEENNLARRFPEVAKEWHPTENGDLTPFDVTPGSERRVWWKGNCGHEWSAQIKNRTSHHSRCPFCFGKGRSKSLGKDNNLAVRFPEIAKQWHATRNGDLSACEVSPGSTRKVWWQCERGHEWPAIILNRTRWPGCPRCRREPHVNP